MYSNLESGKEHNINFGNVTLLYKFLLDKYIDISTIRLYFLVILSILTNFMIISNQ